MEEKSTTMKNFTQITILAKTAWGMERRLYEARAVFESEYEQSYTHILPQERVEVIEKIDECLRDLLKFRCGWDGEDGETEDEKMFNMRKVIQRCSWRLAAIKRAQYMIFEQGYGYTSCEVLESINFVWDEDKKSVESASIE